MKEVSYSKNNYSTNVRKIPLRAKIRKALLYIGWLVAPEKVNRLVKKGFFIPRREEVNPADKEFLSKATKFSISVREAEVQGWKWGKGPAIVFAHGWNGIGMQFRSMIEHFFKAGYTVITYDAPGHGISGGTESNYFVFSDTMRAILSKKEEWNIQAVVGHSLGAAAAINALSKNDYRIKAVLIAPPLKIKDLLYNAFNHHGIPYPVYNGLINELQNNLGYNIDKENPGDLLSTIHSETLIIHDTSDRAVPFTDSAHFSAINPEIKLMTTTGFGHGRILREPEVIQKISEFISKYNSEIKRDKELIFRS